MNLSGLTGQKYYANFAQKMHSNNNYYALAFRYERERERDAYTTKTGIESISRDV